MVQFRRLSPDKVAGAIFSPLTDNTESKSTFDRDFLNCEIFQTHINEKKYYICVPTTYIYQIINSLLYLF